MLMRLRRRISEGVSILLIPAICVAVTLYFGYSGVFGGRGLFAWSNTQSQLEIARHDLAELKAKRTALQHRISLLGDKVDPDLLEEVARTMLLEAPPGEVAVPREKR
jgi:cell division protein FtsB